MKDRCFAVTVDIVFEKHTRYLPVRLYSYTIMEMKDEDPINISSIQRGMVLRTCHLGNVLPAFASNALFLEDNAVVWSIFLRERVRRREYRG